MSRLPQPNNSKLPQPRQSFIKTTHETTTVIGGPKPTTSRSNLPRFVTSTPTPGANVPHSSGLQKRVFKDALTRAAAAPKGVSRAIGSEKRQIKTPTIMTKRGPESVIKQAILEKTVQRSPLAEYISKRVTGIEATGGGAVQYEITSQQVDPTHGTESAGVNQTVSVTSSLSVTAHGRQTSRIVKKRTVKDEKLLHELNKNPYMINRLVLEETEDVENTIKMAPPVLVGQQLENFPMRRKIHNLRLSSEPMAMLEQSVMRPIPTADEVDTEEPPEVLASIIEGVDKGATPNTGPHQIFHTLFPEVQDERIRVSTVVEEELPDIVVPTETPEDHTEEILTEELQQVIEAKVRTQMELPAMDVVASHLESLPLPEASTQHHAPNLEDETPPWKEEDILNVSAIVGASPRPKLDCLDISLLNTTEEYMEKLVQGMEYYLDAETCPFETNVQIRGTHAPPWFPGYMAAFPHIPEVVRVNKSPSDVLLQGWKAVQPKMFSEDSILMV